MDSNTLVLCAEFTLFQKQTYDSYSFICPYINRLFGLILWVCIGKNLVMQYLS